MTNNNESMATVVETFFVEETINLIHDNDALAKWNAKVEELGLEGQRTVLIDKEKSPIPFLWMNAALVSTFKVLCPTGVDVEKYDKTPIPVELLEVVGLCMKEGYFAKIKVWYNEKEKDPVIIGYTMPKDGDVSSNWSLDYYSQKYLIGRWADVKASLDSLVERAKKIFFQQETIRLKKEVRERQRELEDLESTINDKFGSAMPTTDDLPF